LGFEEVVLKGLAQDGGLFIPHAVPLLSTEDISKLENLSFQELAIEIFSRFVSESEIPRDDLRKIVEKSYSTFREKDVTPTVTLDQSKNLYLLELFHGPTFAFKDVALQFLGNLFEYFLVRRNQNKSSGDREHLTVIGATSGDTGSAAIYGLRGKKDVSVFIMHPKGKISPIQEAQMTTVTDANVHNLAVEGTFDDCQDFVKALFGDEEMNKTHRLAAVNSINWARILAQITYYFASYFSLKRSGKLDNGAKVRFVVPTGNFGDILAGYFAKSMGLPINKLVIATNENDILYRFWRTGHYEKKPVHGREAEGGYPGVEAHEDGVKETLAPAMDILVSSNFERLLWFLAFEVYGKGSPAEKQKAAGEKVKGWLEDLKSQGGFGVDSAVLDAAKRDFESERVSDKQILDTIKDVYAWNADQKQYVLDPHSAIGVAAALRSAPSRDTCAVVACTAHPAKFSAAVEDALKDQSGFDFNATVLPKEFVGLEKLPKRVTTVARTEGLAGVRRIVIEQVEAELQGKR